jgi:predicted PurR-regulated permease PerM
VDLAGRSGFTTLARYVRGTAAVAVVDAVGTGVGLVILGAPLAGPLSTLVFFGAFIPVVGSVVAGAVAVLVALVTNGAVSAIIVLVVGVMQLESHVLQPSCSVALCACTRWPLCSPWPPGSSRPASWGALLAVPLLAVLSSALHSLATPPPPATRNRPDRET